MRAQSLRSMALVAALGAIASGLPARTATAQPSGKIAKIDPCKLVTQDEIKAALLARSDESLKSKQPVWSISPTSTPMGDARICRIHWQATAGSNMLEKGDISLTVYDAEMFKANVSDMNRRRRRYGKPDLAPIPGIGDEAHFFGYSEKGNPEARVGEVAVGIEFLKGKPSVDLLRAAVSRIR